MPKYICQISHSKFLSYKFNYYYYYCYYCCCCCCYYLDASVPPWVGYNEEEQLKAQIMEISAVRERKGEREKEGEVELAKTL